jgi:signal transduction histidine kinase
LTIPSIRGRLANALLLWSLVWSLGVALAVALAAQHEVDELLDESLQAAAVLLASALTLDDDAGAGSVASASDGREFAWQLVAPGGRVLRRSANAPASALLPDGAAAGFSDVPGWRVHGSAAGREGRMLYVAHTTRERREARSEVVMSAVLAALSIGLLGHFWLRLRVRGELRPLERLSSRLATHDPLHAAASARTLGAAERAELVPVHRAIDALGERLAQRVAQERLVAAHAAHALRTPLAGMDAQLAVALRESAPEAQPRLQRVRNASVRLQRVVRSLLDLFRIGSDLQRRSVALPALLAHLPVPGLEVVVADSNARVEADPDLLAAALANLLDNAQRHGATRVEVTLPAADRLRLADDGRGVAPERLAALRAALRSQSYEGQTGLGLMLADLVARAHGGRLELPEGSPGFAAELVLGPVAARREPSESVNRP